MHGLGNDFVIINNLEHNYQFSSQQIQLIANRKFGIGCDQVLLIEPAFDQQSDFYYRIYNADGSLANQCGNGARCFIRYLLEHNLTNKKRIQLQTQERVIYGEEVSSDIFKVMMGAPKFDVESIPLKLPQANQYSIKINQQTIIFAALSMGNPHAVIYVENLADLKDDLKLSEIAIFLQKSTFFPQSVNVNFIYVMDQNNLALRTYERGAGFTLACGSGACASAAIAIIDKQVLNGVNLTMPGGTLQISWQEDELWMQGQAENVFSGEIQL